MQSNAWFGQEREWVSWVEGEARVISAWGKRRRDLPARETRPVFVADYFQNKYDGFGLSSFFTFPNIHSKFSPSYPSSLSSVSSHSFPRLLSQTAALMRIFCNLIRRVVFWVRSWRGWRAGEKILIWCWLVDSLGYGGWRWIGGRLVFWLVVIAEGGEHRTGFYDEWSWAVVGGWVAEGDE